MTVARQDLARLLTAHVAAETAWRASPTYGPAGRARKQAADDVLDELLAAAKAAGWTPRNGSALAWVEAQLAADEQQQPKGNAAHAYDI